MANRLGEDALAARERASYRDYLNAMANTNIRGREQESMDRYRQGELGIRGQDVTGLNEFRRGQVGIGTTDAATRAAAATSQASYQQGLIDAAKAAEANRLQLGLGQNELLKAQIEANKQIATSIPPLQKALVDQYGVAGAIQQAPGLFGIQQPENLRLLQAQKEAEDETAYRNKLMTDYENALKQYRSDVGSIGWLDWTNPDDPSTEAITNIMAADKSLTPEDAAMEYASRLAAPFFPRQASRRVRPVAQTAAPQVAPAATPMATQDQSIQPAGRVYTPSTVGFYPPTTLQSDATVRNIRSLINNGITNQTGIDTLNVWDRYQQRKGVKPAAQ